MGNVLWPKFHAYPIDSNYPPQHIVKQPSVSLIRSDITAFAFQTLTFQIHLSHMAYRFTPPLIFLSPNSHCGTFNVATILFPLEFGCPFSQASYARGVPSPQNQGPECPVTL